jgi:hypothetical protein
MPFAFLLNKSYSLPVQSSTVQAGRNRDPLVITTSGTASSTLDCELEERDCPGPRRRRVEIDWRVGEHCVPADAVKDSY